MKRFVRRFATMKIQPYLNFPGNAEDALKFYEKNMKATTDIKRYTDGPMCVDESYKGKIMHATVMLDGEVLLMLSDCNKVGDIGDGIKLSIDVSNEDEAREMFSGMSEGGDILMPLEKQFWGDMFGMLKDKFGVTWMVNCSSAEKKRKPESELKNEETKKANTDN